MTQPANANLELILSAITEVKTVLSSVEGRVRALEGAIITQSVTAAQRLDAAFSRIDEHTRQLSDFKSDLDCRVRERVEVTDKLSERISKIENDRIAKAESRLASLEGVAKIAVGLSVILAGLITTLLWKIFTGEVQIK